MTASSSKQYQRNLKYLQARRNEARLRLGGKCKVCESEDNLEFDHINPSDKSFTIASHYTVNAEAFWAEVDKCQLLCTGCHLEKTIKQLSRVPQCGTFSSYFKGCRCNTCRTEWNEYHRQRRQKIRKSLR